MQEVHQQTDELLARTGVRKSLRRFLIRSIFSVDMFVLVTVVGVVLLIAYFATNEAKSQRLTCSAFSNYSQAYTAYLAGNWRLDENKDGHPCNALYNKYTKSFAYGTT